MKRILDNCSKRWQVDGWCLKVKEAEQPLHWTMCTTRQECRELQREMFPEFRDRYEIVKVKVQLVVV